MKIRDRIIELRRVKSSELLPNPKNWRTHPEEQANAMRSVLAEIGIAGAAIARETPDGLMLIDGHLRTECLDDVVPVLVLDVDEDEADKLLATFDPIAEMAGSSSEKLSELLKDLTDKQDTLSAMVWPDYILDPLLTADWSPEDVVPIADGKSASSFTVTFIEEQKETVLAAIAAYRQRNGEGLSESQCLELMCLQFLDGCK